MNWKLMRISMGAGVLAVCSACVTSPAVAQVDFVRDIQPILEVNCLKCHGAEQAKGSVRLHTLAESLKQGDNGPVLVPDKAKESRLFVTVNLPADADEVMPPVKEGSLSRPEIELLRKWIEGGAKWPAGVTMTPRPKVNFVKDIQPIFEFNCVACHREGYAKGGLRMDNQKDAFKGGDTGPGVVPGDVKKSLLFVSTSVPVDDERLMPPKNKNGPLPKEQIDLIRLWVEQGARWPEGLLLTQKKLEGSAGADEGEVVAGIHQLILSRPDVKSAADMKAYTNTIPGTDVSYSLLPIPAGEFVMGSPAGEKGRAADEGPPTKVKIAPFWMGKFEVTWNEFELFMYADEERKFRDTLKTDPAVDRISDAVARPTKPYVEMSFGMGKDGFPAISMTQHAANKYCQWLSAKMGHFYRLPTEAEWEYACRAGTTTAYSWGDDPALVKQFAWFENNSDFKYQKIGKKLPNPWGLHDMHGNVAEWVLDQYQPNFQALLKTGDQPWLQQSAPYGQVVRGGSWDDRLPKLRSAARRFSDKSWKQQDPQLPKSIWYLTDAQFLGFRVVRPLAVPSPEAMRRYWNNGVEKE